jgi:D-beta-D-heptose 7-phosphate kinase/D-beta-D-heptose 1-phosphate adenosyltransferase
LRAHEILERCRGRLVVVLGDVMLDRYVWGDVSRISPEAPVPVVLAGRETIRMGGAANVAANLRALGAEARLVSVVGADADGAMLRGSLEESGIATTGLRVADRPTTVKTRILARNQQVVRVDREESGELSVSDAAGVLGALEAAFDGAAALVISDYGKGVIGEAVLGAALTGARLRDIPVAVDPKETHFFSYRGVTALTPNVHEAGAVLGRKLTTESAVDGAGKELRERLDARSVLITRGERGMTLFEADRVSRFPAVARDVYDVTGAGDTVVATLCLAHAAGASLREATELSNYAASVVIREVGTAVARPDAIVRAIEERRHD